jgi:hypothetical protein
MDGHQNTQDKRELNTMYHVETKQSLVAYLIRSQKEITDVVSNEGRIAHDGGPYGNSPISQLIPGKKVSCVTQSQGEDEKDNSKHPIELTRRPVGTSVEYPDHVEEDCSHHPVSRPPMQVS